MFLKRTVVDLVYKVDEGASELIPWIFFVCTYVKNRKEKEEETE